VLKTATGLALIMYNVSNIMLSTQNWGICVNWKMSPGIFFVVPICHALVKTSTKVGPGCVNRRVNSKLVKQQQQ
jgi:hypothetical protein